MGLGSLVSMVIFKLATLVVYVALWQLVPWKLPADTWWSWAAMLVLVDLGWYFAHRFAHRVRIAWAGHQAHHSSEYFNFGTALRQKWNPWTEAIFWLPLPLLGFPPWTIYIAFSFNLIYQFFIHTETVGTLPRPIELVFNTPSHHRVHHGSDPEYLDRNYGGILIIWDRLFGSFQEEKHRPRYGLTKPVDTYNLIELQYGEYRRMVSDVRRAQNWRDRLGHVRAAGLDACDAGHGRAVTSAKPLSGRISMDQGPVRPCPRIRCDPPQNGAAVGSGSFDQQRDPFASSAAHGQLSHQDVANRYLADAFSPRLGRSGRRRF